MGFQLIKNWLRKFKAHYTPRYNLALDSHYFDVNLKQTIYRFKVYSSHSFVKFSFEDILENKNIAFDINPYDLIKVSMQEEGFKNSREQLHITEFLRGNQYKVSNALHNNIFSGDEICNNPLLIEQIKPLDIYKIAFSTGFSHGRQLHQELNTSQNQAPVLSIVKNHH